MRRVDLLGHDIGGVAVDFLAGKTAEEARSTYLGEPSYPFFVPMVRAAVKELGASNVFSISRCGPRVEEMVCEWLDHIQFYSRTGFDPGLQLFTRTCEAKADVIRGLRQELERKQKTKLRTGFVEDRVEVLSHMHDVEERIVYNSAPGPVLPAWARPCKSWLEVGLYTGVYSL